nr:transposase [Candidatus Dependentiae bacterium]
MPRKKTAEALAKTLNKSGDTVLRILKDEGIDTNELICKAQQYFGDNKVNIIIDDTIINKMYSKNIEGTGDIFDPVSKRTFRSLCSIVAMISDGRIALPVLHTLLIKQELSSPGHYKTKAEIAQEFIDQLKDTVKIKIVLMDGLYASSKMITWCNEKS